MTTTRQLAAELGCTPQAINKAIRKACEAEAIDHSTFGRPDPRDKRIRTFSREEIELIIKYAPEPKPISRTVSEPIQNHFRTDSETQALTPIVETEAIAPTTPEGLVLRTAQPIMQVNVNTLNVNLVVGSTQALDQQTQSFNATTAQAFHALRQVTKDELKADIQQMRSQNKNVVAGIQASAAVEAVQELFNEQRVEAPQTKQSQQSQNPTQA